MKERRGLLMAVVLLLAAFPALAAQDVYVIRDVPVDETAASANEARRIAIQAAEVEAWSRLVQRLVVPGQEQMVPQPGIEQLDTMVQSLEIDDERITSDRYRALVTVRFRGESVRGLLDQAGVAHAMEPSPLLLVLPVQGSGADAQLWIEGGPWLAAWQNQPGGGEVVDVIVPFADLEDIVAIDAQRALAGDWEAMKTIMGRYEADGVLVAQASETATGLDLAARWYEGPQGLPVPILTGVPVADGNAWAAAVARIRLSVDDQWSAASTVPEGPESELIAEIPIRGLEEWVDIRRRLERPAALLEVQPLVVSTTKVRLLLRYVGEVDQLDAALGGAGLDLQPNGVNSWLILPL